MGNDPLPLERDMLVKIIVRGLALLQQSSQPAESRWALQRESTIPA